LYQNKIESSYARNFISKIQPQNTSNYSLGQTTIFNIPCMANQVLSGVDSVLNVRLCLRNGANALPANGSRLDGAGIISAIQRVRIFHGSQLLSDIDSYGNLMNLLFSAQCSSDLMKNKYAILMGSGENGAGIGLNSVNVAATTDFELIDMHNFSIPLMSIFNLTNNYVPCWALTSSSLRLETQWASSISQFVNYPNNRTLVAATGFPALFSDVSLTCNFMELSDSAMAIIQNSLQGNPVEWVCTDWSNYIFNTNLPQAVANVSMAVPAKYNSLKSLLFTFRPQTSANGTQTNLGNGRYGSESIKCKLSEYDARIGSRVIPSDKPNTVSQFYSEFLRAISSVGNLDHETNITRAMYYDDDGDAAVSSKFCVGFDLESYSAVDLSKTYQGLNTSTDDIFANFRFGAQGAASNIRIDAYASFDKLIICQNGGVVGVSY
jgi:hypothetical protein